MELKVRRAKELFELTEEQQEIVQLPLDARLLVTAGPGTGKTHTMTARIYHMVTEFNVAPGSEILVLTFTRAAVREIRRRCRSAGGNLSYVAASTFDSFATRLLKRFRPEALQQTWTYDDRVAAACRLVRTDEDVQGFLRTYRHVFVDEIQDLVGVRSEFVKAILEYTGGGFSLLGDPAQSIYNFQLEGPSRETGSRELYEWLVNRYPDLLHRRLTKNHRARSKLARWALKYGQRLGTDNVDYEEIYDQLVREIDSFQPRIGPAELTSMIRDLSSRGRVALLCRKNGECLHFSRMLWTEGISHHVRRPAEDRYLPKWLALTFRGFDGNEIRASALKEKLATAGVKDPDAVYDILRRSVGGTGSSLRVSDLRERLSVGLLPDELEPEEEGNVVISTIHRAKGLEFDSVLFVWSAPDDSEQYPGEEARVWYVALTRPTKNLVQVRYDGVRGLRYDERLDRWIIKHYGWQLRRVEVKSSDVSTDAPPGRLAATAEERLQVQEYLASDVKPGDFVTLVNADPKGTLPYLCFHIQHGNTIVGMTNRDFSTALERLITGDWRPGRIHDVWISGVRTVVGDPAETKRIGIGRHGMWLVPEIMGLGNLGN